jgi:hypothetical protein
MGLTYGAIYLVQKRIVRNRSLQIRIIKILGGAEAGGDPMVEKGMSKHAGTKMSSMHFELIVNSEMSEDESSTKSSRSGYREA